ncbi:MAG: 2-amino-4-hydroxy-6-hydroxymethyldihydropteridine diphosphokinase [Bacteroidota bacterium]
MIFLGVGTNLGNKTQNILQAYGHLEKSGVKILRKSALYHSEAWGIKEQDSFINAVVEVDWEGSPEDLLAICLEVEKQMGRERLYKWGPRLIDIDIICFHDIFIRSRTLSLPHPYYTQRAFVLAPLVELEPEWIDKSSGKTIQDLLKEIPPEDMCVKTEEG